MILADLREKRLWPFALVLIIALVAVPVVLSKPAKPLPATPAAIPPADSSVAAPGVKVSATPLHASLKDKAHDPFKQQKLPKASATSATTGASSSSGSSSSLSGSGSSSGSSSGGASAGGGSTTTTTPTTTTPSSPTTPRALGLTATESYDVSLAVTTANGGLDTIDPLERLSLLPGRQDPLLVELGVLRGGHRVLFVVQPGTVVHGAGRCTPGTIDCEVISLAPGQVESLSRTTATGTVPVNQFSVTRIATTRHATAAAAGRARRAASAAGRALLAKSTFSALSLFHYAPTLGAIVDQRTLTVGGG